MNTLSEAQITIINHAARSGELRVYRTARDRSMRALSNDGYARFVPAKPFTVSHWLLTEEALTLMDRER